ncbi:hypothetical protein LINGRAPRIM_LOCUS2186 [Linum grandiflorum]
MMIKNKVGMVLVLITLLLFIFASLKFSVAVPTTRSLKYSNQPSSSSVEQHNFFMSKGAMSWELIMSDDDDEGRSSGGDGRMEMERTMDYPGTGANNHHDPRKP